MNETNYTNTEMPKMCTACEHALKEATVVPVITRSGYIRFTTTLSPQDAAYAMQGLFDAAEQLGLEINSFELNRY